MSRTKLILSRLENLLLTACITFAAELSAGAIRHQCQRLGRPDPADRRKRPEAEGINDQTGIEPVGGRYDMIPVVRCLFLRAGISKRDPQVFC